MDLHSFPVNHIVLDTALNLSRVGKYLLEQNIESAIGFAQEIVKYLEHAKLRDLPQFVRNIFNRLEELLDHFLYLSIDHFHNHHFIEELFDLGLALERSVLI